MKDQPDIEHAMETARLAVEAAAAAALRHWRTDLEVERKADDTPVTAADRDSEAAILGVIRRVFPGHAVLAEESGAAGSGDSCWIVDPVDGTRGFSRGGTFWGPLVALEHRGEVVAGAAALPALGVTYWAGRGLGAFRNGERLRLSEVARWAEATLSLGELRTLMDGPWAQGVLSLVASAASTRCYGDLASCLQLLDGRAEVWLETGVKVWDIAPLKVLVEEAGGIFTDFQGRVSHRTGQAAAANRLLHPHVLERLLIH